LNPTAFSGMCNVLFYDSSREEHLKKKRKKKKIAA